MNRFDGKLKVGYPSDGRTEYHIIRGKLKDGEPFTISVLRADVAEAIVEAVNSTLEVKDE